MSSASRRSRAGSPVPAGGRRDARGAIAPARVVSLHRYPVKSMLGEEVPWVDVDPRGCVGDRVWSVLTRDGKIGSGKTTRRFAAVPRLQEVRATELGGRVMVTFPDGTAAAADSLEAATRLSRHVGQPVTFAVETQTSHFDDGPVSLVGRSSVMALAHELGEPVDPNRFRGNVLFDGPPAFAEDDWVGRRLRIGSAVLLVGMTSPRCVMIDAATADLPPQHGNLLAIGRLNGAHLGVIATVDSPGRISVGDAVRPA